MALHALVLAPKFCPKQRQDPAAGKGLAKRRMMDHTYHRGSELFFL